MDSDLRPLAVHVIHSLDGGGTERMLVALLRSFDSTGVRHRVATLREAGSLAASLPDQIACRPLSLSGRSWSASLRLARLTRAWRATIVHARNIGCWLDATVASRLTPGSRLVLGFHGLECDGVLDAGQRRKTRLGLHLGARFVSVSEAGKRKLNTEAGIPLERITVLPNGVDLKRFPVGDECVRQRVRAEWRLDQRALVFGIVGRLTPVKGHATLIQAVARAIEHIPTIQLLVVGDGPLRGPLLEQVRAQRIEHRVRFTGEREDIARILTAMDACVCASKSEGRSNALLEAMAAGLPIIATRVGDNALLVRDDVEGLTVEPGSVTALTEAILTIARSSILRDRMSGAARARAHDHSLERTVQAYERFYHRILGAAA